MSGDGVLQLRRDHRGTTNRIFGVTSSNFLICYLQSCRTQAGLQERTERQTVRALCLISQLALINSRYCLTNYNIASCANVPLFPIAPSFVLVPWTPAHSCSLDVEGRLGYALAALQVSANRQQSGPAHPRLRYGTCWQLQTENSVKNS